MTALSNSEQNIVSEMAKAVAKMLDSDKKGLISNSEQLRDDAGFTMWVKDGAPGLHVQVDGAGKVPNVTGKDASASQEEMWAAYRRWQERKIVEHVEAPLKQRPLVWFVADVVRNRFTHGVILGGLLLLAAGAGISSCSEQSEARNARVNKYGIRYGDVAYHWTYPGGCHDEMMAEHPRWTSVQQCRAILEAWEAQRDVWVDWKDASK